MKFSRSSAEKLSTCHIDLQTLANAVVLRYDCTVVCGTRSEVEQNDAYAKGNSRAKYPDSAHNFFPSRAIDLAPYVNGSVSWNAKQCYHFAGYVMRVAEELGINIRWGGDWDSDRDVLDQSFNDLVHFELVES